MNELLELKKFVKECIFGCRVQMDYHFGSSRVYEDRAEIKAYENMLYKINEMLGVDDESND